jgi:hypothetical protein
MMCDFCDEKIKYEATIIDLGRMGKLNFCNQDCKENYIDDCTTEQILDEELDALEDKYYGV